VSWTAPTSVGASAITSYVIDIRNGTTVVGTVNGLAPSPTNTVVTGLVNGTAYNFVVRAINARGSSFDSAPSNVVVPATTAVAPTIGAASPGSAQATVNWTTPVSNGGSPITGYEVQVMTGTGTPTAIGTPRPAGAAATNLVVTGLTNGTAYRFQVRALNAVGAGPYSALSTAVTPVAADVTAPTVTVRTPANAAVLQSQATNVTATFSEPVQAATVTAAGSVTLRVGTLATGALVPAVVTYNAATRVVTLNPNANLAAGTRYTVRLTNAIKDVAGNTLAPVSWTFSAGPAPVILAHDPAVNATNVLRTRNVAFRTDRLLVGVNTTSVRLVRASTGVAVAATVTVNALNNTVTINPTATLAARIAYRVVTTSAVTDQAGNPLAPMTLATTATTWQFTTGLL
jgi:hypothetical protein